MPASDEPVATEQLVDENQFLKAKLEEMARKLAEAEEVNQELLEAKALLSDEIVDLTKVLFEEANGMVANEVRARTVLEQSRRKLQSELEQTKDRLRDESQQLSELKQRLYDMSFGPSTVSLNGSSLPTAKEGPSASGGMELLLRSGNYFDALFPTRRFNSKLRCNGHNAAVWEEVIRSLDVRTFKAFARFLEVVGTLDDEAVLGSPFVKHIYEDDVVPCLGFDAKPKTFAKKVVQAMFRNTCTIERISASSPLPSPIHGSPCPPSSAGEVHPGDSTTTLNSVMSELALSFTALPDIFVLDSNYRLAAERLASPAPSTTRHCSLCGLAVPADMSQPLYRFRLAEKDPVMLVDEDCRSRLVAAAEFYTFLRHLRRGLFANRPIIDLYYELMHYLRNMFYARTSSTSFFIQSDHEVLCNPVVTQ